VCNSKTQRLPSSKNIIFALGLAYALFFSEAAFSEEIDRLLASVNGKVITEGDLKIARILNPVLFGSNAFSDSEQGLSQLIDFELLSQELKNFGMTKEDEGEIESRIQSLRASYASKGGLPAFLKECGLQESELISYLRLTSSMLQYVNFRFRPFINVTQEEIQSYYENILKPQMDGRKGALPPLEEVSAKIEEVVRESKITESYNQWIASVRRNARIERFDKEPSRVLLELVDR
jgi:hypothetical protein